LVRTAGTTADLALTELPDPTWRFLVRRGLPQFVLEAVAPVLAFYVAWKWWGLAPGIAASTVVSLALAAVLVRLGRDVGTIALGTVFVLVQAGVALAAHSTTVYLAQPVVFSTLLAFAYIASVAVGRPLIGVFAAAWYPFPRWFRESVPFKREFGLQTLLWAAYMLARAALRLWALLRHGVGGFVVVSLLTGSVPPFALVAWGLWHARRTFSRLPVSALSAHAA
jgi:hypothetical protein